MEAEIDCPTCAPRQRAPGPPTFKGSRGLPATNLVICRSGDMSTAVPLVGDLAETVLGLMASTEFSWNAIDADTFELAYVGDGSRASFFRAATDAEQYRTSLVRFSKSAMSAHNSHKLSRRIEVRAFILAPDTLEVFVCLRNLLGSLLAEADSSGTLSALVMFGDQAERFLIDADSGDLCAVLACAPEVVPATMIRIPCTSRTSCSSRAH